MRIPAKKVHCDVMPMLTCERCRDETAAVELCNYCGKKICYNCMKSSQRHRKTLRLVICKSCWSSMPKRMAFKTKRNLIVEEQAAAKVAQRA